MSGQFVKVRKDRQWLIQNYALSVTNSQPSVVFPLVGDSEGIWSFGGHVLRVLTGYQVFVSNGTAGASNSVIAVGLVRMETDLAAVTPALTSALTNEDADMPWLYWRVFPLPLTAVATPEITFYDYRDGQWLDWQMRAGKGTYVNKDVMLCWVITQRGLTSGSVTFCADSKLLVSSP